MTVNAVLNGGPGDGLSFESGDATLIEIEVDDVVSRYTRTTRRQQADGEDLEVFTYAGAVDPARALDGTEQVATRISSPLLTDRQEPGDE